MRLPAKRVTPGVVTGYLALSSVPMSFLGELDPETGRIDNAQSELHGTSVAHRILTFPEARGSTVGPYVLYGARKHGVGPLGMIVHHADAIVASAAVLAGIPCVAGVDVTALRQGETVTIDADAGYVDVHGVEEVPVVTSILEDGTGRVLLLKRSDKVGSFQGLWAGVSGYIEPGVTPRDQAMTEVREETGIAADALTLRKEGPVVYARDGARMFAVHPFLFRVSSPTVTLDWEHTESRWIEPFSLPSFATVPRLDRVFRALGLPSGPKD